MNAGNVLGVNVACAAQCAISNYRFTTILIRCTLAKCFIHLLKYSLYIHHFKAIPIQLHFIKVNACHKVIFPVAVESWG